MQKAIAYKDRAEDGRRRALQAANAKEREAEERMAAARELLATTREQQIKGNIIQPALVRAQINMKR
jgi:hypothetical protein